MWRPKWEESSTGASEAERVAAQLEQIYQATKDSQDREIVAAASVISTLVGAPLGKEDGFLLSRVPAANTSGQPSAIVSPRLG